MTFYEAETLCRDRSRENHSGLYQLLEDTGSRVFVAAYYLRGKKRFIGHRAQIANDKDMPPRM